MKNGWMESCQLPPAAPPSYTRSLRARKDKQHSPPPLMDAPVHLSPTLRAHQQNAPFALMISVNVHGRHSLISEWGAAFTRTLTVMRSMILLKMNEASEGCNTIAERCRRKLPKCCSCCLCCCCCRCIQLRCATSSHACCINTEFKTRKHSRNIVQNILIKVSDAACTICQSTTI